MANEANKMATNAAKPGNSTTTTTTTTTNTTKTNTNK
jgi:hypothetical protein